jgi:hypothetical protein
VTPVTLTLVSASPDEPDQVPRLERFPGGHPGISVRAHAGY